MENKTPINSNGKIMLLVKGFEALDGLKKIAIRAVANVNRNRPMVSGVAEVNFTNTGTPAINSNVVTASMPICILLS